MILRFTYNAAFAAAKSHNPAATARVFLTDGEHTAVDPYANAAFFTASYVAAARAAFTSASL